MPGKSHGPRSLVGYNPWGRKESDMTERLHFTSLLFLVLLVVKNSPANARDIRDTGAIPRLGRSPGGGHSSPLLYYCLRNPMDRGAWWASVRVDQHRVGHDYFGHLMQRVDSVEKTLMLGGIGGKRRRG